MHPVDIENCLASMEIIVDTREQPSERAEKRYKTFGCPYRRQKLNYGDYTYNFTLPDGSRLFPDDKPIDGHAVIERKEALEELSGNLAQQHDRFAREFDRAKEHGASVYLMVENASWEKIMNHRYKTKLHPNAFLGSLTAFMARYRIQPIFCQQELSGKLIAAILKRELKERLEAGFYG